MQGTPESARWLAYYRPNVQAQLRLFCFPYAGGGAAIYRSWATELPTRVEVCPIQLPARETRIRENAFTNLNTLIPVLAQAITPYLNLPFAFFGHSMGALIAFELARFLRETQNLQPIALLVSGRPAPHLPIAEPSSYQLSDPEFMLHLRQLNGTPEEVLRNKELMQLLLPSIKADFELCETYNYRPGTPFTCPISVFGGSADSSVTPPQLEAWQSHTTEKITLRILPGDHFFINSVRPLLLTAISQDLTRLVEG
jgi:medium-chain acyl-[acyl-carrier-protein] hydrolase